MSILGYARVSTGDQDLAGQKRRLQAAGAYRVFEDVISGKTFQRTVLADLFDHLCPGDSLAVVRPWSAWTGWGVRSASSSTLLRTSRSVRSRSCHWKRSSTPRRLSGKLVFHVFGALAHFERRLSLSAPVTV
jgi:DNA invertase Pin-like site-specific DNA recombinase